jgi:hypothetical protein
MKIYKSILLSRIKVAGFKFHQFDCRNFLYSQLLVEFTFANTHNFYVDTDMKFT